MINDFPTLTTNNASRSGTTPWKALIFSMVILGLALMIYIGLRFGYKSFILSSIENAENRIIELERIIPKEEVEEEFIQFYSQLTNIRNLLESHTVITPFFIALEANTMENVGFSDMTINIGDRIARISGFAESYEILARQIAIYENMPGVERAVLTSARRVDNIVNFELRIALMPNLFKLTPAITSPLL